MEYWLSDQIQRVVISGTKSSWRIVTSSGPQTSLLGLVLFNIINELGDGAECTLSKLVDDSELGEIADIPEGHAAIQRK
ncbi:hypothetical protein TURU_097779 [Turdus rufiventris]|nr:hypothetical protein TURU_097779 [Turdus rufiventris]